jgi:hypothetical protein
VLVAPAKPIPKSHVTLLDDSPASLRAHRRLGITRSGWLAAAGRHLSRARTLSTHVLDFAAVDADGDGTGRDGHARCSERRRHPGGADPRRPARAVRPGLHRARAAARPFALGYNNNYAPVTIGPDGSAYVGTLGGLVRIAGTR